MKIQNPFLENERQQLQVDDDKLLVSVTAIHQGVFFEPTRSGRGGSLLVAVQKARYRQLDNVMVFMQFREDALSRAE